MLSAVESFRVSGGSGEEGGEGVGEEVGEEESEGKGGGSSLEEM